jgi:hypothetical protein
MADKRGIGTFVNEQHELASDSIDLYTIPPIDKSQIHGKEQTLYPTSVLTSEGPIEFLIPSDSTDFTALHLTRLEGEIEIVKSSDGTALAATDKISIVNLLPHALFKQIECSIKDIQINDLSTPTYPYKSFIETHLTYSPDLKKTTLKDCECYIPDTAGKENSILLSGDDINKGFVERQKLFIGKKINFSIVPHIDFFQSPRLLIPGCDIKLKFIRSDDSFCLIQETPIGKIKINNLRLRVRRITLDPSYASMILNKLNSTPVAYPIVSSKIKTSLINSGVKLQQISQMVRGKLPRSFLLCFVSAKAFDGNVNKNPFVFENFKINYLNVFLNGEAINPTVFQPEFTTENYTREYRWFLDNIGLHQHFTNGVTKEDFKNNSCFFPFDLSPDLCNNVILQGIQDGTIDVHVGFETPLTENIYCLMLGSYDEMISIDKNRNVIISS